MCLLNGVDRTVLTEYSLLLAKGFPPLPHIPLELFWSATANYTRPILKFSPPPFFESPYDFMQSDLRKAHSARLSLSLSLPALTVSKLYQAANSKLPTLWPNAHYAAHQLQSSFSSVAYYLQAHNQVIAACLANSFGQTQKE